MQNYQVPQFIEEESKLVGPFSFTQIFILAGGGGIALLTYNLFPQIVGVPITIAVGFITFLIVFTKVNDVPMYRMVVPMLKHFLLPKSYLWKQPYGRRNVRETPVSRKSNISIETTALPKNNININELSKILDKKDE